MSLYRYIFRSFISTLLYFLVLIGFTCFFYSASQLDSNWITLFKSAIVSLLSPIFWIDFYKVYKNSGLDYTLKIIISSLTFILLLFLGYAFSYRFFKNRHILFLNRFLSNLEMLPIVTLVLFLQWGFISLYKVTGYHLLTVISTPRQPVFFVPFLILSLFPFVFIINFMSSHIRDAYQSNYFLFAKSIGLTNDKLFFLYIIPNLVGPLEMIIGLVYLEMISVMIFIELQFNTGGIMTELYMTLINFETPKSHIYISAFLIILLIPYFFLKASIRLFSYHFKK